MFVNTQLLDNAISTEQYLNFLFTSLNLVNKIHIRSESGFTLSEAHRE